MKKIILSTFLLLSFYSTSQNDSNKKPRFEYVTIKIEPKSNWDDKKSNDFDNLFSYNYYQNLMDSLGNQGYELISVIPIIETVFPNYGNDTYHTGIKSNTRTKELELFFKRKK